MNADSIRTLYEYHFAANRKLWDTSIVPLSDEQFRQPLDYSIGSIHNQVVHLMDVEEAWFCDLRNITDHTPFTPEDWPTREVIRAQWDKVEANLRAYLDALTDEECNRLLEDESGYTLPKWQIMIHVLNHATDHRAQILAMLHTMGAPTFPQDMIFHYWGGL